jgi:hypothetical protein
VDAARRWHAVNAANRHVSLATGNDGTTQHLYAQYESNQGDDAGGGGYRNIHSNVLSGTPGALTGGTLEAGGANLGASFNSSFPFSDSHQPAPVGRRAAQDDGDRI